MDETLGSFEILGSYLPIFLQEEKGESVAYNALVSTIGELEKTNQLGIFRPDLYKFFQQVAQRYSTAHIAIYSNNADADLVRFAGDVLRYWGEQIGHLHFCFAYDRLHDDRFPADQARGEYPLKTLTTIRAGYANSQCVGVGVTISKNSIYFFDDLKHSDLMRDLGAHYIRVNAYQPVLSRRHIWDTAISPLIDRYGLEFNGTVPRGRAVPPGPPKQSYSALRWFKGKRFTGGGDRTKTRKQIHRK